MNTCRIWNPNRSIPQQIFASASVCKRIFQQKLQKRITQVTVGEVCILRLKELAICMHAIVGLCHASRHNGFKCILHIAVFEWETQFFGSSRHHLLPFKNLQLVWKLFIGSWNNQEQASEWHENNDILTTKAPSPRTALRANSGTGSHDGRPKTLPRWSHISANRTGFGAVPLMTPNIQHTESEFNCCWVLKPSIPYHTAQ